MSQGAEPVLGRAAKVNSLRGAAVVMLLRPGLVRHDEVFACGLSSLELGGRVMEGSFAEPGLLNSYLQLFNLISILVC